MEIFKSFMENRVRHEVRSKDIKSVLVNENAHNYYKCVEDGKEVYYVNQIDDYIVELQTDIFDIVETIKNRFSLDNKKCTFKIVKRVGVEDNSFPLFLNDVEYKKPQVIYEILTLNENNNVSDIEKVLLEDIGIFTTINECEESLSVVKILVNTLSKKVNNKTKDISNQDIFEYAGVKEQTFYNWKKSKPKLIEAIECGYLNSDIDDIVQALSKIPKINYKYWNSGEMVK